MKNYATLTHRIKASVIDSIIVILLMYALSEIFRGFESVSETTRFVCFIVICVIYEPLFVSLFGHTIGHSYSKIMVKQSNNPNKNISFPKALIRYILKVFLGWISLLTVSGNPQKQAIHDIAAGAIVYEEA